MYTDKEYENIFDLIYAHNLVFNTENFVFLFRQYQDKGNIIDLSRWAEIHEQKSRDIIRDEIIKGNFDNYKFSEDQLKFLIGARGPISIEERTMEYPENKLVKILGKRKEYPADAKLFLAGLFNEPSYLNEDLQNIFVF